MAVRSPGVRSKVRIGHRGLALFRRLGYRHDLESRALACLERRDARGCRQALLDLLDGLDSPSSAAESRRVVQLLLDILHGVNRRLNRVSDRNGAYLNHRASLIERFADCDGFEPARRAFRPALDDVLAQLDDRSGCADPLMLRARAFIEGNYQRRLALSSVAAELHVSPSHLSRVFRRDMRVTVTEYIHTVRLSHARRLMGRGDRSISEIAYRVGYQNYRDFYRNFVKSENASPRQVRRRLLEEGPEADSA